jgi:iron complex outermembrane receptor protein
MNVSRSWQPPSLDNLVDFDEGPNSSVVYTPLSPQHAWTIKVGTRGEYSRFEWELSFYRSWFRNELLEVNDAFGNDIGTRNVPRTNHQGIEASLEVELLRDILMPKQSNRAGDRLSLDQSYTLNDFHFDQNSVYGDNRLPGIPVHVYEAQSLYQSPSGFYAEPNLQCNLSRYPVDEANTLFADSYVLLGFRAGFRRSNGFSVFIDCRNLTNQHYAASIDVIADARTEPNPEIFHPGDGRFTAEFPGRGELFRSDFSGNPDRFCVREFAHAGGAQFAAETGAFYAAEWQTRIGGDHRVDENHSAVQL